MSGTTTAPATSGRNGVERCKYTHIDAVAPDNPFSRREEHARYSVHTYRILTLLTWLLAVVTTSYYTFRKPGKHDGPHRHRLWKQDREHETPFAWNSIIVSVYWIILFLLQIGYVAHLFARNRTYVNAAANVGSHFILHKLLLFAFVMLWVRGIFWAALLVLLVNFFNLSAAYFRHAKTPRFIHIPVVSGPLAWNFVALYWTGAAVDSNSLLSRILANVAIWGILAFGILFLAVYKDYTMGFDLSALVFAIGAHQFLLKLFSLQWIFVFIIGSVLFILTTVVAFSSTTGWEPFPRRADIEQDREREPLIRA